MHAGSNRFATLLPVALMILIPLSAAAEWWDGFGPAGVEGGVYCMTGHFEDLYVGGLFDVAGGVPADNVARFNGRHWLNVDGGTDGRVHTIYSTATTIIIGGIFWLAGGTPCDHVADLHLGEWTPMGDGLPDWPNNFTMHFDALYACGKIDADGDWGYSTIARWDGLEWHEELEGFGQYSLVNEAYDIEHFDESLYIGGSFTFDAPDPDIHNIAEWTGTDLVGFGFLNGEHVNCLQAHDNVLYIGGDFSHSGSTGSYGLAWLTAGGEIHPVAQADVPRTVVDLDIWNGGLIVGQSDAVIPYSGTAWLDTLGGVLAGQVNTLAVIGTDLYVSGGFAGAVARWDRFDHEWVGVGGSPGTMNHERGRMFTLCRFDGDIIAGGDFGVPTILADETHCYMIGRWDGRAWHRMERGFTGNVVDLAVYDGELIAGGSFEYSAGKPIPYLARWDGETWNELGNPDDRVWALCVYDGELIAAGMFSQIGGVSATRIAAWNGSSWRALGAGLGGPIEELIVHQGDLYAGGHFDTAGGAPADHIARWDGSQWHPVGTGISSSVYALATYGGEVIAGGAFGEAGGVPISNIARWDGDQWRPLGAGVAEVSSFGVLALLPVGGDLYVGGDFGEAGGAPANCLAVWDGSAWSEFEGGVQDGFWNTAVYDLLVHEGDLYAAGDFTNVGGRGGASSHIARWVAGTLTPVVLHGFDLAVAPESVSATWQTTAAADADAFELTGEAAGQIWIVPHVAESVESFRAVDRSPRAGTDGKITYTLWFDEPSGQSEVLARRTVTLDLPAAVRLLGAHPNPFNPGTTVAFELDWPQTVRLDVYDLSGRRIASLAEGPHLAGRHEVRWDGRDARGREVGSGTYVARLQTGRGVQGKKLVLVR